MVMGVLKSLVQILVTVSQRILNRFNSTSRIQIQLWNMSRLKYYSRSLLQWKMIREASRLCMFLSNQFHPIILHMLMISMNVPTLLSCFNKRPQIPVGKLCLKWMNKIYINSTLININRRNGTPATRQWIYSQNRVWMQTNLFQWQI